MTILPLLLASSAWACPLCHTATAEAVRAALTATAHDQSVLCAVALPFVAIGLIVLILERPSAEDRRKEPA